MATIFIGLIGKSAGTSPSGNDGNVLTTIFVTGSGMTADGTGSPLVFVSFRILLTICAMLDLKCERPEEVFRRGGGVNVNSLAIRLLRAYPR